ncbi:uncharacterized protein LOC132942014 [Metopolophium dirhodum]|uniref:uncharacterized protein LOC132942014 n=1 Tax=Metopolophium dirhodum TaxID=44670 RepID=UPI00298FBECA|nr:uncharacterized protein LOC132942014 [Metopolophium dirhodum]
MPNDSSSSLSWFNGDSYNRDLAATPPFFFISPERTFVLRDNRPPSRPVTLRPVTPRPIAPALDDSMQDGQRPWWMLNWFSPQSMPVSPSPQRHPFRYSNMTQDSGFFPKQQSQSTLSQVRRPATPSPPTTPEVYALNLIENMEFSPSPLRQSQMDEWLRSFSPISPDILPLDVVGGVVFSPSTI